MKKISLIVTSLVFCIAAVFIFPAKEANANPLAVGGALYLGGAGVYVVGAVAVAGIAGIAGCESCQEDIEAHAQRTWEGSTQVVKDGIQLMIDASIGAGAGLTAVDANVNTWVDGQIGNMAQMFADSTISSTVTNGETAFTKSLSTTSTLRITNTASTNEDMIMGGQNISGNWVSSVELKVGRYSSSFSIVTTVNNVATTKTFGGNLTESDMNKEQDKIDAVTTLQQAVALISSYGVTLSVMNGQALNIYNQGVSQMREAWQDMTDAGLVLPVDNARPMAGDIPLTYDPVSDTYAGIDGITVPHEDVTGFEFQKPHWKTLEDLAALGLSGLGAGLYIDGWPSAETTTSTYDPATDITTTTTSTGTTTNVTTGETAITGTTTTTTTGDTTGNPTTGNPPTASKPGDPLNPFKVKPMPIAALTGLFQLLAALIFYLIRMFTFIATIALIAPTPIDNPYFLWFVDATFYGIKPFRLVQNLALFFLGFSVYRSVRRVFG